MKFKQLMLFDFPSQKLEDLHSKQGSSSLGLQLLKLLNGYLLRDEPGLMNNIDPLFKKKKKNSSQNCSSNPMAKISIVTTVGNHPAW